MGFELFYDLAFIVGESMVSLLTGLTGLMRRLETLYRELNALWGYTSSSHLWACKLCLPCGYGTDEKGQLLVYMYSHQSDVNHLFRSQPQRKE